MRNVTVCVALAVLVVGAVIAAGPTERGYVLDEVALKSITPQEAPNPSPRGTTLYSGTTVGGPNWDRPFADFSGISGLGPVTYHQQLFYVDLDGAYDVSSVQTGGWDGYLFVYVDSFDPLDQLTNGVAGDDDGVGGIGTSDIVGAPLQAGHQYFAITTGFANGDEGPLDNTISGPGNVFLGPISGVQGDLGITMDAPLGVVFPGPFSFDLDVTNAGPDAQNSVVVTDVLSAELSYVSDTCGGVLAGSTWTWTIGDLAFGGSASCSITVQLNTPSCAGISNTATVSGGAYDPNGSNNSATVSNGGGEAVVDGSFEGGTPNASWAEASTNFGSPLCTVAGCGTGTGTGPRTGSWWTWFGGISAYEEGSMSQSVTIAPGSDLTFWLEAILCDSAADYLEVTVDGNQVYQVDGGSALCGSLGYTLQTVDLAPYDDGGVHVLEFHSEIFASNGGGTNFFVDDVSIPGSPTCTTAATFDLSLSKGATTNGDGTGTYSFLVTNLGPDAGAGIVVTDPLPTGVTYVSDTCGGSVLGGVWTWNIGALAASASASCQMLVTIVNPAATLNTATVSGTGSDPNSGNNVSSAELQQPYTGIPTLGTYGVLILTLVLAGAGMLLIRRRI